MWVLGVFVAIETGEIRIRKAVNASFIRRRENEAFINCALEVMPDTDKSKLMLPSGPKCIACTLVDGKGDIRPAMSA